MMNETFVASSPHNAYVQAVKKYESDELTIISAKQLMYDDGVLRCEVVIAIPKKLFMEKSFGDQSFKEKSEEYELSSEIGDLKAQLELMRDEMMNSMNQSSSVLLDVKKLFNKKGISYEWLDDICNSLIGTSLIEDKSLLASYLIEEIDEALKIKEESVGSGLKVIMLVGPTGVGKTTTIAKLAARYSYLMSKPYKVT